MSWISGNYSLNSSQMKNNANLVWAYFHKKGWTKQSVSAMLGNMQAESTINPGRTEDGGGGGYGLVQWTPKSNLVNWCTANGLDYRKGDSQCAKIQNERDTGKQWIDVGFGMSFKQFSQSKRSPTYLADVFIKCYERPYNNNQPIRGQYAEQWFSYLKDTPATIECIPRCLIYSNKNLIINQGENDTPSHVMINALDIGSDTLTLPVDVKVVARGRVGSSSQNYFESTKKVTFPNGNQDVLCFYVDHSYDRPAIGSIIKAGNNIIKKGDEGLGSGAHYHVMCGKGHVNTKNLQFTYVTTVGGVQMYKPNAFTSLPHSDVFWKDKNTKITYYFGAKHLNLKDTNGISCIDGDGNINGGGGGGGSGGDDNNKIVGNIVQVGISDGFNLFRNI